VLLLKHVAKWQLPDAVEFIEALPLTATGKVSKLTLRKQFSGYQLADMT
jgi:non-ribosomal peptide synthetase component E (peptide arylation enzyme)